jgi:hypothetical protein
MLGSIIIIRRMLWVVLFHVIAALSAHAQMDWMPQILRDLPPEFERGLPSDMSLEEYRALNRDVDFFTVGMSLLVPGYGLFEVGEPVLGASVLAGRIAGYGLIATGVARQWADLRDVGEVGSLEPVRFDNVRDNLLLVAAGGFLNAVGWGLDVLGAYHIASRERDFVIYKYGIQRGFDSEPARESLDYIRALRDQLPKRHASARLDGEYRRALENHLAAFPYDETQAIADFYLAEHLARSRLRAAAISHAARASVLQPTADVGPRALELLAALIADWPHTTRDGDDGNCRTICRTHLPYSISHRSPRLHESTISGNGISSWSGC